MNALTRLRAPIEDGETLAEPPLRDVGSLLEENRSRFQRLSFPLLDRSLKDVRRLARRELLAGSSKYVALPDASADHVPLILAGHQPELFHPGVWIKNFAIAGLARRFDGLAINLIVDNDTVKSTALRLPGRGNGQPHFDSVAFDRWQGEIPWEERRIYDSATFAAFGKEVVARMRAWNVEPILASFWGEVQREAVHRRGVIGESFAAARRSLERSWGCVNRELPLSHLCCGEAFAYLAGDVLSDLPRFAETYNHVVQAHRKIRGIRSRNHPVPDLTSDGDWLEAPFWVWQTEKPRRERLFARRRQDRLELRAGAVKLIELPLPSESPRAFLEAWRSIESDGIKIRSRALVTTLFSRLLLGDLFVHGIGGGKYDELTDDILRRRWNLDPPRYLVLSGTKLLPLPRALESSDRARQLKRLARDLYYNPQRHVPANSLTHAKQQWIESAPTTRAERRERFRQLRELNEALHPALSEQRDQVERDLRESERQLKANEILQRRDYTFCLYPSETLRPFCTQFL